MSNHEAIFTQSIAENRMYLCYAQSEITFWFFRCMFTIFYSRNFQKGMNLYKKSK